MGPGYEIARALAFLIERNHPAWSYTPRQLAGWMELYGRQRAQDLAEGMIADQMVKGLETKQGNTEFQKQVKKLIEQSQ